MHILLVSACEKRAIKKTRALLDSYALRVGEKTWSTPITQEALIELRTALKRTATRQTAVACYRNDGRRRMKLLWTVGSRLAFGPNGHFPAGTKTKSTRTMIFTPSWASLASLLARAAGLLHDIGKSNCRFQDKLRQLVSLRDEIRHEWISVKLLQALRHNGGDWKKSWDTLGTKIEEFVLSDRTVSQDSCNAVSSACEAIDYLILSHHGLPWNDDNGKSNGPSLPTSRDWLVRTPHPGNDQIRPAGELPSSILEDYWKLEKKLRDKYDSSDTLLWRAILLYARAALIFADHVVSAEHEKIPGPDDGTIYANTDYFDSRKKEFNQPLGKHLQNVGKLASETVWRMSQLTALKQQRLHSQSLPGMSEESVEKITAPADLASRFAWQNQGAKALAAIREHYPDCPALILNMAGTGSGKTRMNARLGCIVSRENRPRLSISLNLRSLTLQTGAALSSDLGIGADELATVIGDRTTQELFDKASAIKNGCTAMDDPDNTDENWPERDYICTGNIHLTPEWMEPFLKTESERLLIGTPLLVSTIDFIIAAGTPDSQGHHVKALLRLMSSDLILDEIDGYEPDALVAVLRLVQLSAFFRRNVICSSATLSLPVALAVETAFKSGVGMLNRLESYQNEKHAPVGYIRALIDDMLPPVAEYVGQDNTGFSQIYQTRLNDIAASLRETPPYRKAMLYPVKTQTRAGWFNAVFEAADTMHRYHQWEFDKTGKTVSFGLVRVASVSAAIDLARFLSEKMPHAKIACYHSQEFLIARFHKERRLDSLLSRKNGNAAILNDTEIRQTLSASVSDTIPFIVVATPVEEIGRDHDFDWGVIEPSSSQSIVQTAGRINRHRFVLSQYPNVSILQYNLRHCINAENDRPEMAAFIYPGYEKQGKRKGGFKTHDLTELLPWADEDGKPVLKIDARLRFDTETCLLAEEDDKTISNRLTHYYGINGYFVSQPVHSWILTTGPYDRTPLRDKTTGKEQWKIVWEDGKPDFYKKEREPDRWSGRLVDVWKRQTSTSMRKIDARPNAWLALPPEEMSLLCVEMDIALEQGMQAELLRYKMDAIFEYDPGFGVKRTNTYLQTDRQKG